MKKPLLYASAITSFVGFALSSPAGAETVNDRIEALEQLIQLLKRQVEVNDEKAAAVAEKSATVELGAKGLVISSPDKSAQLSLRGYAQVDNRAFIGDEDHNLKNDFLARRVRPIIEGKYGNASLRIMPDFAVSTTGASPRLFDAYAEYKLYDELQFRFGKFKPPVGLERLQSATDTFFNERGQPTNLAPNRDLGVQVFGEIIPGQLEYQLAIMNGAPDLANNDSDDDDKKDYIARVFGQPFANSDIVDLQGLGIGIAGSVGERRGSVANPILTSGYKTSGQQTFFKYNAGTYADGINYRVYPQAYWYSGNVGVLGEYAVSVQEISDGTTRVKLTNDAWQVAGSFVLTGEDVNFKGGIKPYEDFNLSTGGIGAWELVGRLGQTDIDDDAFPIFATETASATEARTAGVGINWYLNQSAKLAVDYDHTEFSDGSADGSRENENVIISRVQYRF